VNKNHVGTLPSAHTGAKGAFRHLVSTLQRMVAGNDGPFFTTSMLYVIMALNRYP
jgi:hypothetical protein